MALLNAPSLIVNGLAGFGKTPVYQMDVNGNIAFGSTLIATSNTYTPPTTGLLGGVGDRIILSPGNSTTQPVSIGIADHQMWSSVPSGSSFHWYLGGTSNMSLSSSLFALTANLHFPATATWKMGGGMNWFNKSTPLGYFDQGNGWRISSATSQPLTFNGTGINMQFDGTTVAAIKSVSSSYELQVTGTDFGQIRLICGNYGMFFCNNGTTFDLLSSSSGAPTGARNGFVPFRYNMVSGAITFGDHSSASVTIGNDSTNTVNVNGHLFASSCISTPLINTGLNNVSGPTGSVAYTLPTIGIYIFQLLYGNPATGYPTVVYQVQWDGSSTATYTQIFQTNGPPQPSITSVSGGTIYYSQGGAWWGWGSYQILYLKVMKIN